MKQEVNKLTPGSNMFWESSRMMLPEHKEALIRHGFETRNRRPPKPDLDEQERENINRALTESKDRRLQVRVELYHPYEECKVIGTVERIELLQGWFQVDGERFKMNDIMSAEIEG